jgi:ABC-2 type transport system ATP-binding protein
MAEAGNTQAVRLNSPQGQVILEARELRKSYGAVAAVKGVTLTVSRGEFCGLLGPNGAGKTTIISMICGILEPDGGEVRIFGQRIGSDTSEAKRALGYVPQDLALFEELTASDNLRLFGSLYGLEGSKLRERMGTALEVAGLSNRAEDRVSTYSGGMKRRLNLAAALLHDPEFLILDEPTAGVDPQSRGALFEALKELQRAGKTMLYTTHYMEEVERLCERVVVVDQGQVVADDTLAGLGRAALTKQEIRIELAESGRGNDQEWLVMVRALPGVRGAVVEQSVLRVEIQQINRDLPPIMACLEQKGIAVNSVASAKANLEDIFFHLTGRALRD